MFERHSGVIGDIEGWDMMWIKHESWGFGVYRFGAGGEMARLGVQTDSSLGNGVLQIKKH